MIDNCNINTLAKNQVSAIFHSCAIRRSVLLKFTELCMETPCWPFAFVTLRPYCPGRPKKLCFTTQSLAVKTAGARLSVVKQSFFGLPGQYGRRVTKANVGAHPDGHQHGGRKPVETSVTEFCYKSVNLSLEELKNNTTFSNARTVQIAKFPEISLGVIRTVQIARFPEISLTTVKNHVIISPVLDWVGTLWLT